MLNFKVFARSRNTHHNNRPFGCTDANTYIVRRSKIALEKTVWSKNKKTRLTYTCIRFFFFFFQSRSVDANMEDDRTRVNSVVNSSGSVIWVEPVQYSIHCQTDTTHWPHDTQTGVLRLGSWMYMGNVLNLTTDNDGVGVGRVWPSSKTVSGGGGLKSVFEITNKFTNCITYTPIQSDILKKKKFIYTFILCIEHTHF